MHFLQTVVSAAFSERNKFQLLSPEGKYYHASLMAAFLDGKTAWLIQCTLREQSTTFRVSCTNLFSFYFYLPPCSLSVLFYDFLFFFSPFLSKKWEPLSCLVREEWWSCHFSLRLFSRNLITLSVNLFFLVPHL